MTTFAILDANLERQDFTPNPDPAKGEKQDQGNAVLTEILAKQGTIGTRSYDWSGLLPVAAVAASTAFGPIAADGEYELCCDVDSYLIVASGEAPTATPLCRFMPAGGAFTLRLSEGDLGAVIARADEGTLTILPVA